MLNHAISYLKDYGFSVIPLNPSCEEERSKRPLIKWAEFQTRKPTEKEIISWWNSWPDAMIGLVCGPISNLFVLDADTEYAHKEIEENLPEGFLCPIVKTPRGWHYWFRFTKGLRNSNNGKIHCRGEGGYVVAPPSRKEDGSEYKFLLKPSTDCPFPYKPHSLNKLINDNAGLENQKKEDSYDHTKPHLTTTDHKLFNIGSRDDDLFHLANVLFKGGESEQYISEVIENIALNVCNPPFSLSDARVKVSSALDRKNRSDRNIANEVYEFILTTSGHIMTTDVHNGLQVTTRQDKKAVVMALLRLLDDGIIERYGTRNGSYRRVEDQAPDIDIFESAESPLSLHYPLGVEKLVYTMPKSIIVVAGESDAGKTAFLLSFSMLNMDNHNIIYYSSEMGATELRSRIEKFERPIDDWKKVQFKERSSNFQDLIQKDSINIIDYLELSDDFYRVGAQIKGIFDKLKSGIAIIALQKKIGAELARGGDFTMEKARLYLSLSRDNICKVIKAKNWVNPMVKPTGKAKKFVLLHGCKFLAKTEWIMADELDRAKDV